MNLQELPVFHKTRVLFKLFDERTRRVLFLQSKDLEVALINVLEKDPTGETNVVLFRVHGSLPSEILVELPDTHVCISFRIKNVQVNVTVPKLIYHGKLMCFVYKVQSLEIKSLPKLKLK